MKLKGCFYLIVLSSLFIGGCRRDAGSKDERPAPRAAGNKVTGNTIKIGLSAPITGRLSLWGSEEIMGARLAVDEINAAGGVRGKSLELLVEDEKSTFEGGEEAARKLVSQGAVVMFGGVASGIAARVAKVAYETGVPLVLVAATRNDLTDIASNIFRVCSIDRVGGAEMALFTYEDLGLRKIAIMTDRKQPYSIGLSKDYRYAFEKLGGQIVTEQFYESGQTTFQNQLKAIKEFKAQGVFISGYFTEASLIVREMAQMGLKIARLGGDGWDNPELIAKGGPPIIGSYIFTHFDIYDDRPFTQAFLKRWKARYGRLPTTNLGALTYDAVRLIAHALKRAKSLDSQGVTEAIAETRRFAAVTGNMSFEGRRGNPTKKPIIVEIRPTGKVYIKEYTTKEIQKVLE